METLGDRLPDMAISREVLITSNEERGLVEERCLIQVAIWMEQDEVGTERKVRS